MRACPTAIALLISAITVPALADAKPFRSPDNVLEVSTINTQLGGSMPDLVTTVRWLDDRGKAHKRVFNSELGRLGWIEAVTQVKARSGTVYVIVAEDRHTTTEYVTNVAAFRLSRNKTALEPATEFFPALFGANDERSQLAWGYYRMPAMKSGVTAPRPIAVMVSGARLSVTIDPSASMRKVSGAVQRFELRPRGGAMIALIDRPTHRALSAVAFAE